MWQVESMRIEVQALQEQIQELKAENERLRVEAQQYQDIYDVRNKPDKALAKLRKQYETEHEQRLKAEKSLAEMKAKLQEVTTLYQKSTTESVNSTMMLKRSEEALAKQNEELSQLVLWVQELKTKNSQLAREAGETKKDTGLLNTLSVQLIAIRDECGPLVQAVLGKRDGYTHRNDAELLRDVKRDLMEVSELLKRSQEENAFLKSYWQASGSNTPLHPTQAPSGGDTRRAADPDVLSDGESKKERKTREEKEKKEREKEKKGPQQKKEIDEKERIFLEKSKKVVSSLTFQKIMHDAVCQEYLLSFMKSEYCHETLLFHIDVEKYLSEGKSNASVRPALAEKIWETYFKTDAMFAINIDHNVRANVRAKLDTAQQENKKLELDLFSEAQEHAVSLIKADIYQRFLKSDLYRDLVRRLVESDI
eukprot:TRINITY_DN3377_c0_g1_i2.p1 TRINITY_DN3377_c0_g1~~TRINITY_DN3377_c0_g1_i2.p1  ORF type:complete len:423 (+),score=140.11 TRINITY_DN3377_c0_g1_i2:62-1330(+)